MTRYMVTMCDTQDGTIHSQLIRADNECTALLQFSWLTDVYAQKWIDANIAGADAGTIIQNIWSQLSWATTIVDLDAEIMRDLNGGDLSALSDTPQD